MRNKVVIVGGDSHNTLGLVRSYGIMGITPDVIFIGNTRPWYVMKSKYAGNGIRCKSPVEAIEALLSHYGNYDGTVVVQASSDEAAAALDAAYLKMPKHIKIPNATGKLAFLMNKDNMCHLASSVGLKVPQYKTVHPAESEEMIKDDIVYPCITKAISSLDGGKSDTIICKNESELISFLKKDNICHTLIIEQFVDKDIEFQFFGLSLNGGEEIVIPGHSHIHRPGIQNEYYFPYIENDESFSDTLVKAKKFVKASKYSGLFSIEFIRGKDGVDYFLEMNFRNDGNAICVTDAGFNLPYLWYLYQVGGDYRNELINSKFRPVKFCPDLIYFFHMLRGELNLKEWYKTTKQSNSFTVYFKGDNGPFWSDIRSSLKGAFSTIIKRMLNNFSR